jgi:hypothetical protein
LLRSCVCFSVDIFVLNKEEPSSFFPLEYHDLYTYVLNILRVAVWLEYLHTPFEHDKPCAAAVYLRGGAAVAGGPVPVHQPSQLPAGSIQPGQGLPLPVDRQFQVQGPRPLGH